MLSNLYLHYVLDLWFERVVKPRLQGEAYLIRYIDDFVVCFQHQADAQRFQQVLAKRLAKFALALEPTKTRLVAFGRFAERDVKRNGKRLETFTFLGFTHYCTRNHRGNFKVGWKTDKSRLQRSLAKFHRLLQIIRHEPLKEQAEQINQFLRGHYAYYGVAGNLGSLQRVYRSIEHYWRKMLSSRSQKGKVRWEVFLKIKRTYPLQLPKLRACEKISFLILCGNFANTASFAADDTSGRGESPVAFSSTAFSDPLHRHPPYRSRVLPPWKRGGQA